MSSSLLSSTVRTIQQSSCRDCWSEIPKRFYRNKIGEETIKFITPSRFDFTNGEV